MNTHFILKYIVFCRPVSGSIAEYKSMNLKIGTKNIPIMVYFRPFVLKKKKKRKIEKKRHLIELIPIERGSWGWPCFTCYNCKALQLSPFFSLAPAFCRTLWGVELVSLCMNWITTEFSRVRKISKSTKWFQISVNVWNRRVYQILTKNLSQMALLMFELVSSTDIWYHSEINSSIWLISI